MSVQYVYGVTSADLELPPDLRGIDDREAALVRHAGCAVIAGPVDTDRALGTRDDLFAHQRVLEAVAADGAPVLPFRFGAVLPDRDAIVSELLEPNRESFAEELERIQGHVQLTLKGRYVEEVILGEILRERPEIAGLREELHGVSPEAGYYDRVRLGELIAQALEEKATADADHALELLAPHAERTVAHTPRRTEEILDAAFLVRRDARERFERAVDELGGRWDGRVRLRLVGPLPPYDFAESGGEG
ncbi:GvpL/GvpF family gas vesicle protein [Thermomonospora umbrina]|uniref:Gas vesicle protein GvpL/GvpF n=1 Tax=Thermomonospora umbrina TaxID=111806 RepID=A0A3D9SMY8_9ACTN|nr:GvpL/GvpF family gas vesicle protein [Thermomonospora umbrina]REE95780.1 gas vesicle protein GvpL/GvpF [Thermomonospora umbrina]